MKNNIRRCAAIVFVILFLSASATFAQVTEFTYQGNLKDGGSPANGSYDFEFALFDASTGGSQIGATLPKNAVMVTNGLFAVKLDFGSVFPGANRFLEIHTSLAGQPGITILGPRQLINSVPYSVQSLNAATAMNATQLGGVAANQFVQTNDTRLSDARNPLPNSANYIQNRMTTQTSSNFNIAGNGTANIFDAGAQYNIGGNRVLSNAGTSNIFVGAGAGRINTTGSNNSFSGMNAGTFNTTGGNNSFYGTSAGISNVGGSDNAFVGMNAGASNTTGFRNSLFGVSAGSGNTTGSNNTIVGNNADVGAVNLTFATAIGAGVTVSTSNTIVLGRSNGLDLVRVSGLGVGGTLPLCRNANNEISFCSASSLRYKTNIAALRSGLNVVNRLRPITFDWKDGGMHDLGFGAEDVAKIDPLLVHYNAKGEVEGVKYDRIGVVLVNAVNEQQRQIEAQKKQIENQSEEIKQLRRELDELKKILVTRKSQ